MNDSPIHLYFLEEVFCHVSSVTIQILLITHTHYTTLHSSLVHVTVQHMTHDIIQQQDIISPYKVNRHTVYTYTHSHTYYRLMQYILYISYFKGEQYTSNKTDKHVLLYIYIHTFTYTLLTNAHVYQLFQRGYTLINMYIVYTQTHSHTLMYMIVRSFHMGTLDTGSLIACLLAQYTCIHVYLHQTLDP